VSPPRLILGEYRTVDELYAAARALQARGHQAMDFHSPYPLAGSDEVLKLRRSPIPAITAVAGFTGVGLAILMQWWMNNVDYFLNVGNRISVPTPTWVPVTFEMGVLLAGVSIFLGLMAIYRFPQPYDPLFEVEAFRSATIDALWLSVQVKPEEVGTVSDELRRLGAAQVHVVPEAA
jgi:hypothetical protein